MIMKLFGTEVMLLCFAVIGMMVGILAGNAPRRYNSMDWFGIACMVFIILDFFAMITTGVAKIWGVP